MVEPAATKEYSPIHTPVTSQLGLSAAMTLQLMATATNARDGKTASRGSNTLILSGSFCLVAHAVARHVARNSAANVREWRRILSRARTLATPNPAPPT